MTTSMTATDDAAVLFGYLCSSVRKIATRDMDSLHFVLLMRSHLVKSSDKNLYVLFYKDPEYIVLIIIISKAECIENKS